MPPEAVATVLTDARQGSGSSRPPRSRSKPIPRGLTPSLARVPRGRGDPPVARSPSPSTTRFSGASDARIPRPTRPRPITRRARRVRRRQRRPSLRVSRPGRAAWMRTLDAALAWGPDHLSAYALTLEPATPFGRRPPEGLPDEDVQVAQFDALVERAGRAGLERYEVSNFAKPGASLPPQPGLLASGGLSRARPRRPRRPRRDPLLDPALGAPLARGVASGGLGHRGLGAADRAAGGRRAPRPRAQARGRRPAPVARAAPCRRGGASVSAIDRYVSAGLMAVREGRMALTDRGVLLSDTIFAELV